MNIREHVLKAINEGLTAKFEVVDGKSGVRFFGVDEPREGSFIFFEKLGYNNTFGYFDQKNFPEQKSDCVNDNPETLHVGLFSEGWRPLVWFDSGGNPNMLGERHEAADLYQALKNYFEWGVIQEDIDEAECEYGGTYWLQSGDSAYVAHRTNENRFPDPKDAQLLDSIRAASERGVIETKIGESGKKYFKRESVEEWAARDENRGRPRTIEIASVVEIVPKSWRDDLATEKQIARLQSFGEDVPPGLTKGSASDLIDKLKKENQVQCWECGCMVDKSKATWDGHDWYCGC